MIGSPQRRLPSSSLGFRLGSTLALALVPLGTLSIVQAQKAQDQLEQSTLNGVSGATVQAAQSQIDLIKTGQIAARTFAASIGISLAEGGPCVARAKAVAQTIPEASMVAYIPLSGLMTCSSTDRVHDFGGDPLFQRMIDRPLASAVYNPRGPVSGMAVVGLGHPVFNSRGQHVGIVSISLPYYALTPDDFSGDVAMWRPSLLATVTQDGTLLVSSAPDRDLQAALPAGVSVADLPARAGRASYEGDRDRRQILSVTAVSRDLFLVSLWQRTPMRITDPAHAAAPYLLPGLTWIAALIAAAFASSRLVVRHVRALSRSMADYLHSHTRMIVPDITDAPTEIQRLHAAYEQLVRTIEQEEAELQNLIVDKDALLREVNHRSGNSLQIIASVMRMYRREAREPGLQAVLDGLINRVIALSSTHTSLYGLSGKRDVPLDEVLFNVISRLKQIHRVGIGAADKQLDPVRTDAQTAILAALATAEAAGCFFALPGLSRGQVTVALTAEDGMARLRIAGPAVPEFQPGVTEGILSLPRRMLQQFAAQLRATLTITSEEDRAAVEMAFPLPAQPGA